MSLTSSCLPRSSTITRMGALACPVTQSSPTLCDPMDYNPPSSSVHGIFQERILEWVAISYSRESSQPRIKPRSPTSKVDSLPSEPPGKPKNTGMRSLSLLHGIFPTQELNRGPLYCRRILYQQSYQGSPYCT